MTAKELRIGNWVAVNELNYCTVDGIDGNKVYFKNGWTIDPEPIPLTPEILEKAGFENWSLYYDDDAKPPFDYKLSTKRFEGNGFHDIYIASGTHVYSKGAYVYSGLGDPESYGFPVKNLDYLHQLQNLYFALTGQELNIEL